MKPNKIFLKIGTIRTLHDSNIFLGSKRIWITRIVDYKLQHPIIIISSVLHLNLYELYHIYVWFCVIAIVNPFFPNAPFLYPLKILESRKVFWCFQGVEKRCIGSKWVQRICSVWQLNTASNHCQVLLLILSKLKRIN